MNKKCPKCGYVIQEGDRFCINCGYKISQNNKEKLKSMKNEKTEDNSTKSKKQPIKRMKELEATSSDLHSKQPQEFWKKKSFLGIVVAIALVVLVIRANILPKGYSNPNDVMEYCMRRNVMLNQFQKLGDYRDEFADAFGTDNEDTDYHMLLQNKKTKRYVFKYSYDGESIPSYVVASKGHGVYSLNITPVKKSYIASIYKYDVTQEYMDKHFPSDSYVGYSNDDIFDMDVDLDNHISKTSTSGKTWVSYDNSEDE